MNLVGTWILEGPSAALADLGDVLLDFSDDGALTYVIRGEESDQIIYLTYEVDGSNIVTNQPSAPRIERTPYSQPDRDSLILGFGGIPCRFRRGSYGDTD